MSLIPFRKRWGRLHFLTHGMIVLVTYVSAAHSGLAVETSPMPQLVAGSHPRMADRAAQRLHIDKLRKKPKVTFVCEAQSRAQIDDSDFEPRNLDKTPPASEAPNDVWQMQNSGVNASLRGLCAVNDMCCWASGAKGTVIRTTDGGVTWHSVGPPQAEAADFRDIQAWDEATAVIMSAGDVDRLYRTHDGGETWTMVYEHPEPAAFFDGMAFDHSGQRGWIMGDPIQGKVQLLTTDDQGKTWTQLSSTTSPAVADGVAAFAASGTHLICRDGKTVLIGLGGEATKSSEPAKAAVLITNNAGLEWQNVVVPIRAGLSAGVFSITDLGSPSKRLVVVGGDYLKPELGSDNMAISDDAGRTWRIPRISCPNGFRSVVISIVQENGTTHLIATGPSGTDHSTDEGESWSKISPTGFHTMSFVSPTIGWAAGSDGRVARWQQPK